MWFGEVHSACPLTGYKLRQIQFLKFITSMMLESLDYVKRNCGVNAMSKIEKFTQSLRE